MNAKICNVRELIPIIYKIGNSLILEHKDYLYKYVFIWSIEIVAYVEKHKICFLEEYFVTWEKIKFDLLDKNKNI